MAELSREQIKEIVNRISKQCDQATTNLQNKAKGKTDLKYTPKLADFVQYDKETGEILSK